MSDLEEIKNSQTAIMGKLDVLCRDVAVLTGEVKGQGVAIQAMSLWQARSEERLREGSSKMAALAQERKDCEKRHEERTKEMADGVKANAVQMVENLEAQTMKKSDILMLALKLVLAGGAGGGVVAGAIKIFGG